jgi:hypothetical protein
VGVDLLGISFAPNVLLFESPTLPVALRWFIDIFSGIELSYGIDACSFSSAELSATPV